MLVRHAVALDPIRSGCGAVEQRVDQVVVEQVDFVHIEDSAMRIGQQAGLELAAAVLQSNFEVQRSDDPVLGGRHGQVGDVYAAQSRALRRAVAPRGSALAAQVLGRGIAAEPARRDRDLGQQRGQTANRRRLGGAALAANQHAANGRVDGVEHQRELHPLLPHDGGERIDRLVHGHIGSLAHTSIVGDGRAMFNCRRRASRESHPC